MKILVWNSWRIDLSAMCLRMYLVACGHEGAQLHTVPTSRFLNWKKLVYLCKINIDNDCPPSKLYDCLQAFKALVRPLDIQKVEIPLKFILFVLWTFITFSFASYETQILMYSLLHRAPSNDYVILGHCFGFGLCLLLAWMNSASEYINWSMSHYVKRPVFLLTIELQARWVFSQFNFVLSRHNIILEFTPTGADTQQMG